MKQLNLDEIKSYLAKIRDKELYAYGVYQIEANGRSLFSKIEGNEDTIMGLPVQTNKGIFKHIMNDSVLIVGVGSGLSFLKMCASKSKDMSCEKY